MRLAGWGNYPRLECRVAAPDDVRKLAAAIDPAGTIARGLGRSYGDPALLERGVVLETTGLDRMLAFDEATGRLTCEAGLSLAAILETFAPRGWLPRVTPGTKYVTVGGCIANDVHGKAHHADGSFSAHVEGFELLLASGETVWVDREHDPALFWASVGGMGLTGILLRVTMRLRRVETTYFRQKAIVVRDLDALLAGILEHDASHPYSVAWIDPLATGTSLGRGVLTVGDHATLDDLPPKLRAAPLRVSGRPAVSVPFELPELALNPLTLRMLNAAIGRVQAGAAPVVHYEGFFYPLDKIGQWNRGYGARGFTQYQFVVPLGEAARLRGLLEMIAKGGQLPFLNVLKKLGPQGPGHLSFPFEGWTFAIDFPIAPGLAELLRALDRAVIEAGGRVYLGKDAFLGPESMAPMYPRLGEWREIKARVDPKGVFRSALSDRVGLT